MNWDRAWEAICEVYREVGEHVRAVYPDIWIGGPWRLSRTLVNIFSADYSIHQPIDPNPEVVDMDLGLSVSVTGQGSVVLRRPAFPESPGRHFIEFDIGSGWGKVYVAVQPVLLPFEESSPDYEATVMSYIADAGACCRANWDLILEKLEEALHKQ